MEGGGESWVPRPPAFQAASCGGGWPAGPEKAGGGRVSTEESSISAAGGYDFLPLCSPTLGDKGTGCRELGQPRATALGDKSPGETGSGCGPGQGPRTGLGTLGVRTGDTRKPWNTDTHRLRGLTWCRASALGVRLQGGSSQPRRGSMSLFRTPHSLAAVPGPLPAGRARISPEPAFSKSKGKEKLSVAQ